MIAFATNKHRAIKTPRENDPRLSGSKVSLVRVESAEPPGTSSISDPAETPEPAHSGQTVVHPVQIYVNCGP
jgi:hypothetical protein